MTFIMGLWHINSRRRGFQTPTFLTCFFLQFQNSCSSKPSVALTQNGCHSVARESDGVRRCSVKPQVTHTHASTMGQISVFPNPQECRLYRFLIWEIYIQVGPYYVSRVQRNLYQIGFNGAKRSNLTPVFRTTVSGYQ